MIMTTIGEIIAAILILLGSTVTFISAIGTLRFPDVYTRTHAASKSSALGVLLVLVGAFFYYIFVESFISIRLLLGIFFVFVTAPLGAHVICRAAYRSGVKLFGENPQDDLKDVFAEHLK